MEALIVKFGARLPIILSRAASGDPIAIAELIAVGSLVAITAIKNGGNINSK